MDDILGITGNIITTVQQLVANLQFDTSILVSISLVIIVAAVLAFISRLLKQKIILAYIVAGIILGPLVLGLIQDRVLINGLAEIGIIFLLFTAGLEMSLKKLKAVMGTAMLAGIIQVIAVVVTSFFILIAFSFSRVEAIWLGIAIAFSSTVVVTKILADKNELHTLHARLIIGIMLAQDILAIIALAVLSKEITVYFIGFTLLKLLFIIAIAFLLNFLAQPVIKKAASSTELLFIISLAFLFLFTLLAYFLQLSIAIGAFIAGIILANTPYKLEIETKTRALRDFFSVMFFVAIGMWLTNISVGILFPLIPLLIVLIIVEPFVTAVVLRIKGYKPKTSLGIGFSFAQVSEFTLILTLTALSLGVITQRAFDLIILMAVISIALTPYTMKLSKPLYGTLGYLLSLIKRPLKKEIGHIYPGKKTVLLFGCHRMGSVFLNKLKKIKHKLLVIDFNPEIIKSLEKKNISCVYGDIADTEILNHIQLKQLKVVISTIPTKGDNLLIIRYFKKLSPKIFVAVTAQRIDDALEMYKQGADYVISPLIVSAGYAIEKIIKLNKWQFKKLKKEQIKYLKDLHKTLH
jgi:Kef-type K+ transport system membrane component KefB